MNHLVRVLGFLMLGVLATGSLATAQGAKCTHDTLAVEGGPILATFCVADASASQANVTETFSRGDVSVSRALAIELVAGASVTRAGDEVPLDRFGSAKRLHLTVAFRNGEASLEHALLLPGAIVLK